MRNTGLIWIIGILFSQISLAGNLLDAYKLALDSDAEYSGALAANRATRELEPQARASLLPAMTLALSAAETRRNIREDQANRAMELTIAQPIYRKDLWVQLGQAKRRVSQAEVILALARQKLMIRVAERYFGVLQATDELAFARSEKDAAEEQLHQARQRFGIGFVAVTDVQEAQARYDIAAAQAIEAENRLGNAHKGLWEVTGEYLPTLDPLAEQIPLRLPSPNDIEQWMEAALTQNPEVTIARQDAQIAKAEIERVGAGHLPTLDLVGAHNRLSTDKTQDGLIDTRTSSITLRLNVPLYQGGFVLSRTREAIHLHSQKVDDLVGINRSIQRQTHDAFSGVVSGISSVSARRRALQSAEAALKAIETGFQVGTRNSVDVLDAQREVFRAKRDYADVRYDYVMNSLYLKQAAGTLSENDLAAIWRYESTNGAGVVPDKAAKLHNRTGTVKKASHRPVTIYKLDRHFVTIKRDRKTH
ncbi:MAG: TolC family outer membrane protein [Gammaproteobacteria bacterium]|nr:TolC family outer membrane protein [Gammaproteobacteria bacterium]NNJ85130.1 TolC family outer membrane protein [Gammaproteobacteria bacterium]